MIIFLSLLFLTLTGKKKNILIKKKIKKKFLLKREKWDEERTLSDYFVYFQNMMKMKIPLVIYIDKKHYPKCYELVRASLEK